MKKILQILSLILIAGCSTLSPKGNIKVYATSTIEEGLVRKQEGELIKCSSNEFDNFLCIKKDQFIQYMNACKQK